MPLSTSAPPIMNGRSRANSSIGRPPAGMMTSAPAVQSIADGLRRAAKFRQRMEQVVGRIEAMDLEPDAGTGGCVQQRLQPPDVGRLLDRMDEALIPQPGGTG